MKSNKKPYKACLPIETIDHARQKLNILGILLRERHYPHSGFHSCRIRIANKEFESLDIGSGGKGKNTEYSLASAYGEFMERLQNSMLFNHLSFASNNFTKTLPENSSFKKKLIAKDLLLKFIYDPREEQISIKESIDQNFGFYKSLLFKETPTDIANFIKEELNHEDLLSVPFFSIDDDKEVLLPLEIIFSACGSNGMCAGNTKEEALIQGFCEIFERYAGKKIYFDKLTPPTIPLDYFQGTDIYSQVLTLEKNTDYKIIIKDCSLGVGLPVLGILIIDQNRRKYSFNLGSDPSPLIALERCLTEIHQNPIGIFWNDINLQDEAQNKYNINRDALRFYNGDKIFVDGTGIWPIHLFDSSHSYEFKGLNFNLGQSDNLDIEFCLSKIKTLGFQTFIRDVSFLDFPAFYIIVPGMSQFATKSKDYTYISKGFNHINHIKRIKKLSHSELKELITGLEQNYGIFKLADFRYQDKFLYNTNYDLNDLDIELLLFMLNYRIGKNSKAENYMNQFLNGKKVEEHSYFFAIRDYLTLKNQNRNSSQIRKVLANIYGAEEALEVTEDLKNPDDIFKHYEWASCFNCDECETVSDCKFFDVIALIKRIQTQQTNNPISQESLRSILNPSPIYN